MLLLAWELELDGVTENAAELLLLALKVCVCGMCVCMYVFVCVCVRARLCVAFPLEWNSGLKCCKGGIEYWNPYYITAVPVTSLSGCLSKWSVEIFIIWNIF